MHTETGGGLKSNISNFPIPPQNLEPSNISHSLHVTEQPPPNWTWAQIKTLADSTADMRS